MCLDFGCDSIIASLTLIDMGKGGNPMKTHKEEEEHNSYTVKEVILNMKESFLLEHRR